MHFKYNDGKVYRMDEVEIEELPQCGHKSHVEKIMFLAVLARPSLNICDLGFFWSFKSRLRKKIVWSKDYQEMARVVLEVFDAYPAEALDGVWGCLYNNYRSVLESDGGNQYKMAHNNNNGRKRARETTGSSVDLGLSS